MYKTVRVKFEIIKTITIILLSISIVCFSKETAKGIIEALCLCGEVLIPSLYPFMIFATFVGKTNYLGFVERKLKFLTRIIFNVPYECTSAVLLSLIGGYPIGAKMIATMYESKKITKETACKLSYSLVGSGIGFLIIFVGKTLLNNTKIGLCLFLAQVLSVIIIGLLNRYIFKSENLSSVNNNQKNNFCFSDSLIDSVKSSTYSIIEMCGMVIFFSSVIKIFENIKPIYPYIATLLEVTTASKILGSENSIYMLGFAVGFGGLCVHFQIFQILKDIKINKMLFFLFRIIEGFLVVLFTYIFIDIFNVTLGVYSSAEHINFSFSTSTIGSCFLLLTGISFLYTIKK